MVRDTGGHNDRSLELLALTAPVTVLEVGFGQGRTAERVLDAGHRVLGVDVSETMLRQATARNRAACRDGRARLAAGDGVTIPYEDDCADAAFMTHAVYFMDDPEATIVDIGRVVRSGARLVVCCHVGDDTRPTWIDPAVYSIPTRAELESMLDVAGFELVGHEHDEPSDHPTHGFVAQRAG